MILLILTNNKSLVKIFFFQITYTHASWNIERVIPENWNPSNNSARIIIPTHRQLHPKPSQIILNLHQRFRLCRFLQHPYREIDNPVSPTLPIQKTNHVLHCTSIVMQSLAWTSRSMKGCCCCSYSHLLLSFASSLWRIWCVTACERRRMLRFWLASRSCRGFRLT